MKKLTVILIVLLTFTSCSNKELKEQKETSLLGTWKLIEYNTMGEWVTTTENYHFIFKKDNTFMSTKYDNCSEGTYTLLDSTIIINFECDGFESRNYQFKYQKDFLILTPTDVTCIEGCYYKFQKI